LFLSACLLSLHTVSSHAQENHKQTLTLYLNASHQFEFAGYYAARMKGYYGAQGMEVKLIEKQPGVTASDALLQGTADFAVTDSSVLLEQAQGAPIKIIAAIQQHSPRIFLTLASSGIRTVHDLVGKRLMFSKQEDSQLYAMLKHAGLQDGQYTYLKKNGHGLKELVDGKVDAISANLNDEPDLLDRMGRQHYIVDPASYGLDFYGDLLVTTSRMLMKSEERVKAFRKASLQGWEYAMNHPVEVIDYMIANVDNGLSRQHQLYESRTLRLSIAPSLVSIGSIDPQRFQAIARTYKASDLLPAEFDVTASYMAIDHASSRLEKIVSIFAAISITLLLYLAILRYRELQRRKKLELTISEANSLFTTAFDESPLMMAIALVPECTISLVNTAMQKTLGYAREEIIGKTTLEVGIVDAKTKAASLEQIQTSGKSSLEIDFVTRDGEQRHGRLSANLITYHNYQAALFIIEDTTDYRRTEEALRSSELRFRSIFDYSFSGIVLTDHKGNLIMTNAAFENILGYKREELRGVPFREFSYPEDLPEEEKLLVKIRNGESDHFQYKKRLIRKDGSLAWIEIAVSVIRNEAGDPYRFVGVINDISDKLRDEKEKQKLQKQLQQSQKMEAIGQLTGGIAHDFNNILASILGFAELSRSLYGNSIPDKLDSYLAEIITAGERARNIVDQLLTFTRGNTAATQVIDPTSAIRDSVTFLHSTLPSTVELNVDLDEKPQQIYASPTQLNQVLLNLVLNARYAIEDSGKIQITTRELKIVQSNCDSCHQEIDGSYLAIEVCDSGHGIEPVLIPRIFEPFFTTHDMGEGSGMGLAMVHGIMHSVKGHIRIFPSQYGGACVQLLFPLQSAAPARVQETNERYAIGEASTEGGHILVVDDERPLTELIQELLTSNHYRVSVFNDPQQALQAFRSNPQDFDLLLTDQTMPGINGTELASQMRELRPDLPVVLSTGYSNLVHPDNMAKFEIDRLLYKPVNNQLLLNTIAQLLEPVTR
jgi:PAS domain S-box-containing protein